MAASLIVECDGLPSPSSVGDWTRRPEAADVTLQNLCSRATLLGNNISVRLVELLTNARNRPAGLSKLAHLFLEICRILWSIETGLSEYSKRKDGRTDTRPASQRSASPTGPTRELPEDTKDVLETRLRHTIHDFEILDNMLQKNIEVEQKGTVARLQSQWRKIFADRDVERMRTMLVRSRDSLRASVIVLQWSLGKTSGEPTPGFGYTGLVATLDNIKKRPTIGRRTRTAELERLMNHANRESDSSAMQGFEDPRPPLRQMAKLRIEPARPTPDIRSVSDSVSTAPSSQTVTATGAQQQSGSQTTPRSSIHPRWTRISDHSAGEDAPASTLNEAGPWIEEMENFDLATMDADTVLRIKADPDPEMHLVREAVLHHDTESLLLLLLFGADPNRPDTDGVTPIYSAIRVAYPEGAKILLKYGADPNLAAGRFNETPLDLAISQRNASLVQLLLIYGADPNLLSSKGSLPLVKAINESAPRRIAELLLAYDANPDVKNDEGKTALCQAVLADRPDIVTSLLDHGADPNLPGPEHVLWMAVYKPVCLCNLLARGADFLYAPGVMELATSINSSESVRILLQAGVDPNPWSGSQCKGTRGYTPLTTAIRSDLPDAVSLLLSHNADVSQRGNNEWPICLSVQHPHILKLLIPHIKDIHAYPSVMEQAIIANELESVATLLDAGFYIEEKNSGVFSPLTTAIREHREDIVRYLLDRGADPNAFGEHLPLVKALRRTDGSNTGTAVENGDVEMLRLVASQGVDLSVVGEGGRTALGIAKGMGWEEGAQILEENALPSTRTIVVS
ncbi:unnamed protein product [Parascedosporium putredinis]|uniref:Ankyrin n=1 Tax=Parascedosporium putredinis TaxID=1442378 RepID=A0A9P1H3X9_9PEZI|nr:unnamed protein product [Parascedosporium putredinis]CAI7996202.1 unnamed protein product [Parascedosporium putredinis]